MRMQVEFYLLCRWSVYPCNLASRKAGETRREQAASPHSYFGTSNLNIWMNNEMHILVKHCYGHYSNVISRMWHRSCLHCILPCLSLSSSRITDVCHCPKLNLKYFSAGSLIRNNFSNNTLSITSKCPKWFQAHHSCLCIIACFGYLKLLVSEEL